MAFSIYDMMSSVYDALKKSKADMREYNVVPLPFNVSGNINLIKPCNGWTVINQGTTNVTVNGTIILAPNQFIAVGGNEGEVYTGFLRLTFANNAAAGNNALVIQKYYGSGQSYDKLNI
jgi:hypothetical protein